MAYGGSIYHDAFLTICGGRDELAEGWLVFSGRVWLGQRVPTGPASEKQMDPLRDPAINHP